MNIIEAIYDENLFRPFLANKNNSLVTWHNWCANLRLLYGLPVGSKRWPVLEQCTGRQYGSFRTNNADGFSTALFLTGRRSGKSRISAIVGAYEAALAGHEEKLSPGEHGVVPVVSPTKSQSRVVRDYIREIFKVPMLRELVRREDRQGFELTTGTRIEILAGDFKNVRGFTLLAAVIDEAAFLGIEEESKIKSDTELVRALTPALATVGGKLVAISSPYAKRGWVYRTHEKHFGQPTSKTLVWNCASRVMNPTLNQKIIDEAYAEDLAAAQSEYGGLFRDDVGIFIPRELVDAVVIRGRKELLYQKSHRYLAFCDMSGGRGDDAALCIGHAETDPKMFTTNKTTVIIDALKRYRPPFSPDYVVSQMCQEMHKYGLKRVVGDNWGAQYVCDSFQSRGMIFSKCELPVNGLYMELLPRLCSREIELLDEPVSLNQLTRLERRTRSGGKDIITHPQGGHDDLCNAIAGLSYLASQKVLRVGAFA